MQLKCGEPRMQERGTLLSSRHSCLPGSVETAPNFLLVGGSRSGLWWICERRVVTTGRDSLAPR